MELDAFRQEIQRDRLALIDTINSGFDRMVDKFDEHAKEDRESFEEIKERLTAVEGKTRIIGGTLVMAVSAVIGQLVNWLWK